MAWIYLVIAIILEVCGTTMMKLSRGLSVLVPSLLVFVFYGFSLAALALALKRIEVGIAYAIWSGLGTVLITAVGVAWFNESTGAIKLASIGLIIVGVVGLKLSNGHA